VSLAVGGDDPADAPRWRHAVPWGSAGGSDASYLPGDAGLRLLRELAAAYRSRGV
jgi:hypothetical protein